MRYNTFIFDFDYTLGDATMGVVESANFALGKMGLPAAPRDEIRRTVGMSLPDTFTFLTGNGDPDPKALFAELFLEKAEEVMTRSTELFADTVTVLSRLKASGAALGMASTKQRCRLLQIIDKFDMGRFFDVIVGGDDVKNPKPHPEALIRAVSSLGAAKKDVLYIGDSIIDARTAERAGIDFFAVTTGTTTREDFYLFPCIAIVDSLSSLVSVK